MNKLLQLFIRVYWIIPKSKRRRCLFKESCSHHVYRISKENGLKEATKALKKRWQQCRPTYSFYTTEDNIEWIIFSDGSVFKKEETNI